MRAMVVIALQEDFDPLLQVSHLSRFVFTPSKAFFSQSAIKAFDVRLLILLVGPRHAMTITKQARAQSELAFELRATVVLQQLNMSVKAPLHAASQKHHAIIRSHARTQQYIGLTRVDVNGGKSKNPSKMHRIELHHLARSLSLRDRATLLIARFARSQQILFRQNLVDF